MQHIKQLPWSYLLKSGKGFVSSKDSRVAKCVSDLGLTKASQNFTSRDISTLLNKSLTGGSRSRTPMNRQCTREFTVSASLPFRVGQSHCIRTKSSIFLRSFASLTSNKQVDKSSEAENEKSIIESPFDDITYNIPEKPMTFTEGASYSVIILAAFGFVAAAAFYVVKEVIIQPKEYKVFSLALKRIQSDDQVRAKIGSSITGYGQESRNRYTRREVPGEIWTDENGVEHVKVNFLIRGPNGHGKVCAEMFRDTEDRKWKYIVLAVEIRSPTFTNLILESYLPSLKAARSAM